MPPNWGTKFRSEHSLSSPPCAVLVLVHALRVLSHLPENIARSSGTKTRLTRSGDLDVAADTPSWPFFLLDGSFGLGTTSSNAGVSSSWGSSSSCPILPMTRSGTYTPSRAETARTSGGPYSRCFARPSIGPHAPPGPPPESATVIASRKQGDRRTERTTNSGALPCVTRCLGSCHGHGSGTPLSLNKFLPLCRP